MKKNTKQKLIVGVIILLLVLILCGIYTQWNSKVSNYKYDDININSDELNIFYFNVGQADCTLITMEDEVMLIDAGNKSDGKYIVEFLRAQGISKIDYLIETHSDDDHSGGIRTIVKNLEITNVYMPQSAIEKSDIQDEIDISIFSDLEQTYTLGKADWKVLSVNNSTNIKESEDNDTSIVIQLNYGNNKFLFMGDATSKVEKRLINNNQLEKIDVLKVGHHGSNSSSSQNFLDVILPIYSIISVNHLEYSKHPDERTIARLNTINSKIYRTDKNGTIWITSNGTNIEIKELDINVNGNNREAIILEDRRYSLIFY